MSCPRGCGNLALLKKRIPIRLMILMDSLDHIEGMETREGMFGYLAGVCLECGFFLAAQEEEEG